MGSIDMAIVSAYVRRTRKPVWSDPSRFERYLAEGVPDAPVPRRVRRRCTVTERTVQGFPCVTVAPRARSGSTPRTGATVLYLHGGGYVAGIAPQHWGLIGALAEAGAHVHAPLYGLAPGHTFTEAYALLDEVYAELTRDHRTAGLTVMGDSAGGGLALGFAQTLRDSGRPLPRGLVLIAPWLDVACRNPAIERIERVDPWLGKAGALVAGRAWTGSASRDDPRVSPILGSMAGLPPIEAYYGTRDITYADAPELGRAARTAGTPVELRVLPGACHVYPLVPVLAGRAARRRIVERAARY